MKVQNKLTEMLNQLASKSDDTSTAASTSPDFFSELMANFFNTPVTNVSGETDEQAATLENPEEDANTDALLSGLDPQLAQAFNAQAMAALNLNSTNQPATQTSQIANTVISNLLANNTPQQVPQNALNISNNQMINNLLNKMQNQNDNPTPQTPANQLPKNQTTTSQTNANSQLINNVFKQLNLNSNDMLAATNAPDLTSMPGDNLADQQDANLLQQSLLTQQHDSRNEKQINTMTPANSNPQTDANTILTLNQTVTEVAKSTTTATSMQKTSEANVDMQQNKYVNALTQLGNFINNHTTREYTSESGSANLGVSSPLDYKEILNRVNQPDYELKVDAVPQPLDSLLKETYSANIKIYPPELGAMLAKLKVGKNGTELTITTENNRVKEIVEANLWQLRESFQRADINLTNIQIDVQTPHSESRDSQGQTRQGFESTAQNNQANNTNPNLQPAAKTQQIDSIIDTYA